MVAGYALARTSEHNSLLTKNNQKGCLEKRERERDWLRMDGLFRLDRPELDYSQEYLRERNGNLNQWMCTAALAHIYTAYTGDTLFADIPFVLSSHVLSLKPRFLTRRRMSVLRPPNVEGRKKKRGERIYKCATEKKTELINPVRLPHFI